MRLKTALLLALTCVLTSCAEVAYAQNLNSPVIGNITSAGSSCSTTSTPTNCVILQLDPATGVATAQVTGTFTATGQFEVSPDNQGTWTAIQGTPLPSGTSSSSLTATGLWQFNVGGMTHLRVRGSAYTSGTMSVVLNAAHVSAGGGGGAVTGAGAAGSTTTGNPILTGCAFETTPTTVTTGQTANVHCDASGRQLVVGGVPTGTAITGVAPLYIGCDSSSSGTVTAAQVQAVRCNTSGSLALTSGQTVTDGVNTNGGGALIQANGGNTSLIVIPKIYNGGTTTGLDMFHSASLTNYTIATTLTARNQVGSLLTEKSSRWSVISNPAAGSQATASIASEASVRHVVDCVSFSAAATAAPAATALTINIRDGASGAGTIIWTFQTAVTATTGQLVQPHSICGLNLVGTTATAMTAEFSASLANLIESVSISGFNVN